MTAIRILVSPSLVVFISEKASLSFFSSAVSMLSWKVTCGAVAVSWVLVSVGVVEIGVVCCEWGVYVDDWGADAFGCGVSVELSGAGGAGCEYEG